MEDEFASAVEQLRDPKDNVRARAALDLGKLADSRAAEPLIERLRIEPELLVREKLTWALVRPGGVVERVSELLKDPNAQVRHDAAHVLSKIGDPLAVNALIDALSDDQAEVLTKVAFALGRIGDPKAIPALVRLVGHESRELQSTLHSVLEAFGPEATSALLGVLNSDAWQTREQAAYILGFIGSENDVARLSELLKDEHWEVRFAAAHALRDLGGETARAALDVLQADPDARVRSMAARTPKEARSRP